MPLIGRREGAWWALAGALALAGCQGAAEEQGAEPAANEAGPAPTATTAAASPTLLPAADTGPADPVAPEDDALVPGSRYHATTSIPCRFAQAAAQMCEAGVVRGWQGAGTALVEVRKPDGRKRAIFFQDGLPFSADSAEADGSAGWDFAVERRDDVSVIDYGPEHYEIVDALVTGG